MFCQRKFQRALAFGLVSIAVPLIFPWCGQEVAHAQTEPLPKTVEELLIADVLALVHIQVDELDSDTFSRVEPFLRMALDDEAIAQHKVQWAAGIAMARALEVEEAYIGLIPNDVPDGFGFVAVRLPESKHEQLSMFTQHPNAEMERRDDWSIVWTRATRRRTKIVTEMHDAPQLSAARSISNSPLGVAYLPSSAIRNVLADMVPKNIPIVGPNLMGQLWNVQHLVISADLSDKTTIRLTTDRDDSSAAIVASIEALRQRLSEANDELPPWAGAIGDAIEQSPMDVSGSVVSIQVSANAIEALTKGLSPQIRGMQETAARQSASNDLKQIAIACHNHADQHGVLPANSYDENGKPLLSWRVHILPYMDQQELYDQFHLDESWNSEHNQKLIAQIPQAYQRAGRKDIPAGQTVYQRPDGEDFMGRARAVRFRDITDGTSNTIMTIEAREGVVWTKPDDWKFDSKNFADSVGSDEVSWFLSGLGDGSVHVFARDANARLIRALLTINGEELVDLENVR